MNALRKKTLTQIAVKGIYVVRDLFRSAIPGSGNPTGRNSVASVLQLFLNFHAGLHPLFPGREFFGPG
jgi:hypothetical protein